MENELKIPEGVELKKENGCIIAKGKLGEISRKLSHPKVKIAVEKSLVKISSHLDTRKSKRLVNTFTSHIENMIKGVKEGFTYKLKIVYTHFPTNVKIEGDKIIIENFIGERSPRITKKFPGVEVKVDKKDITVSGPDLYAVSQTAANIERVSRIVGKDKRIFQDGIYITEKGK